MIASLPMYDRPANAAAHDDLWHLIRDNLRATGIEAPDTLDRDITPTTGWGRPDLVLGQICNLPLRARFQTRVTVIGAADYGLDGCPAGHYKSVFVVRAGGDSDPAAYANARFAANSLMSQSGYGAPQDWAHSRGFQFAAPMITGAHDRSIAMVAAGRADIAAIDAQTWIMQSRESGLTDGLIAIADTATSPAMTFITRLGQDPAPYFTAIEAAISALGAPQRDILGLRGIIALPQHAYDLPMPPMPQTIQA